jgi:hypothetical protein
MARPKNGNYNEATGDSLVTKAATDAYRDGWDRIFKKKGEDSVDLEEPSNKSLGSDVVLEDEASSQ